MHKSTSFFERIEPFEKETSSALPTSTKTTGKQSLLTGFAYQRTEKEKEQAKAAAAARGDFGETQYPDAEEVAEGRMRIRCS